MISIKVTNFSKAYNSKLLKISNLDKNYVIKLFPKTNNLNFIREIFFLQNFKNLNNIPKIISYNYPNKVLVLNYLKGTKIKRKQFAYINQVLNFIKKIQNKKKYISHKINCLNQKMAVSV